MRCPRCDYEFSQYSETCEECAYDYGYSADVYHAAQECFGEHALEALLAGAYAGLYQSIEEYVQRSLEDRGTFEGVPELLHTYFSFVAYARDLVNEGAVRFHESEAGVYIFHTDW